MLLLNLALLTITQFGSPSGAVTYSNPAARLERLLPELSSASGLRLSASQRMADVVLTIRLDNAPIGETLAKISQVTRGVWVKDGAALRLVENAEAIAREQQAAELRRAVGIHAMFAELHKAIEPKPPKRKGDEDEEPVQPAEVAMAKLLPFLSEDALASLPMFHRIVYSTKPRPLQHALPEGTEQIFEEMVGAVARRVASDAEEAHPITKVPFKTDVMISREEKHGEEFFKYYFFVYDSSGNLVTRESDSCWIPDPDDKSDEISPKDYLNEMRNGKDLRLAPIIHERLRLTPGAIVTPEIREIITKPVEHDPLEPLGAVLCSYADVMNLQLVACPTDWLQEIQPFSDDESLTTSEVAHFLSRYNHKPKNGWLTIQRPIKLADTVNDESEQVDRHELQNVVNQVRDVRCPSLDELIHAIRGGLPLTEELEQGALYPNLASTDHDLCTLLAKLDDSEIEALLSGKRLPYNEASATFQAFVADEVFDGSETLIEVDDPADDSFGIDYRMESTEVADNRALPGAYVQLIKTDGVGLEPSTATELDEPKSQVFYDLSMLASRINYGEKIASKFRFGVQHNYELRIYIGPQSYLSVTSTLYDIKPDAPFISRAEFPADVQRKLDKLVQEMKDRTDEKSGGVTPPPPQ